MKSNNVRLSRHELALDGCAPKPLVSYLKALGVLRLVQSPSSNATGCAADPDVRGSWEHERFVLHTRLDRDLVERFFLDEYAPSPIIAPWNGGSGFYLGDKKDGLAPLARSEVAPRFHAIRTCILRAAVLIEDRGLVKRPEPTEKATFVASLRSCLEDSALEWLDAALALSGGRITFPQLLGTGGNDGRFDFTNNFMQRLVSEKGSKGLFDARTGIAATDTGRLLRASLFGDEASDLRTDVMGQYSPGSAGPNGATGFSGHPRSNPWDFIFALEGAIMFAGSATRRHQGLQDSGASFPFTVRTTGAGSGGVKGTDEENARAEFWAPLWKRPASCAELLGLLREGRAILNGKTARDGLEFARAAASLGTSRGLDSFERYAFVMRSGKAYLAASLGRRQVAARKPSAVELIADLDQGSWLGRIRSGARTDETPARAREALQQLEDSLFALTETHLSYRVVQNVLGAIGDLVEWLQTNPEARSKISPPPRLSMAWVQQADDQSPEFRVSAAVASLGWNRLRRSKGPAGETGSPAEISPAPSDTSGKSPVTSLSPTTSERMTELGETLPMAVHFATVEPASVYKRFRHWASDSSRSLTVWTPGGLASNMAAVLERRLIEQTVRGLSDKPTGSAAPARLADVALYMRPEFDDARCARLLSGLVWAHPIKLRHTNGPKTSRVLPFAYSALKPVLSTNRELSALANQKVVPANCEIPVPPGLVRRLRAGRVDEAVRLAMSRCRASGLASPFDGNRFDAASTSFGVSLDGERVAAALLIPLSEFGLRSLIERAYPPEKENEDAA